MAEKINPLLLKLNKSNAMPGMTFRLPSKGLPYKGTDIIDEDVKDGEIVVHPMSTLDEIYLKTPDMLFQGTAVEKTISRCCPQIKKPLELLSKDVDYILTCMRLVSYGNIITVPYKCTCEKSKEINLEIPINGFLSKTKTIDEKDLENLRFELDGFLFKIKYVSFKQMLDLNQDTMTGIQDETPEELFDLFIKNLAVNIESIDNVEDQEMIVEFLKAQQRKFQMAVLDRIHKVNDWGVNFEYKHICKWCNKSENIPIALNPVSFFTEPSNQVTQSESES